MGAWAAKSRHKRVLFFFPAWVAFGPVAVAGIGSMVHQQGQVFLYTVLHQSFLRRGSGSIVPVPVSAHVLERRVTRVSILG